MIVIQGTPLRTATAGSVALSPVCHLTGFHSLYFFSVYLFIYLSPFLNSGLSFGNCSRPIVSLDVISSPLFPPVAGTFLPQLREGTSHEPFNHGKAGGPL